MVAEIAWPGFLKLNLLNRIPRFNITTSLKNVILPEKDFYLLFIHISMVSSLKCQQMFKMICNGYYTLLNYKV